MRKVLELGKPQIRLGTHHFNFFFNSIIHRIIIDILSDIIIDIYNKII